MSKRVFACALVFLVALPAAPVSAAGPDSFRVSGRGYGHGRGMGQWGARAIAANGRSYRTILNHYYGGVSYASLSSDPAIRAHVGTLPSGMVGSSGAYDVYEIGGQAIASSTRGVIRVTPISRGLVVERGSDHDGPWKRLREVRGNIGFAPRGGLLRHVENDGGFRSYRGSMSIRRVSAGTVWVIVTSSMEEYLRGVVPREMPSGWPAHALRAQAVAARTFALRAARRARERGLAYDLCSTTSCQVFGGYARRIRAGTPAEKLETDATDDAVRMTRRIVMTYKGEPILAEYSSSTGGYTAPGGAPYLKPRPDAPDAASPHHKWSATIPASRIEAAYPQIGDLMRIVVTERNGYGPGGGRAVEVLLDGASRDLRIDGSDLRRAARLRSDWFSV